MIWTPGEASPAATRFLIAGFDVEGGQAGMVEAVAANEIDYEKHQERAAHHNGNRYLQAELKVTGVRDFPHELRSESSQKLRDEHVDADSGGMGALRRQIA